MAITEIYPPHQPPHQGGTTGFQKGHAKVGGRQKGTRNRFGGDLREAVVLGIQAVGFMWLDQKRVMSEASWAAEYQGHPFLTGSGEIPVEKLRVGGDLR